MPKSETRSRKLLKKAEGFGARFRPTLVNLKKVRRKKISWLSKSILLNLGVPKKPAPGSTCPSCRQPGNAFELDHMGPWRQYVAALAGPHIDKHGNMKLKHVRMLYNDPDNLWWICRTCNQSKSDLISEDGSVPLGVGTRGRDVDLSSIIS